MIQQITLLNFARKAYNTSWIENNSEIIQILDSLAANGLHEQIRQTSANQAQRYSSLQVNSKIPDLSFTNLSGDKISLSNFHGKYVLLDFWFIGCRPCQRAVPFKKKLFTDFNECLEILSINDKNNVDDIVKYKTEEALPWTFLKANSNDESLNVLNIHGYPTYYLLDPNGKILLIPTSSGSIEREFNLIEEKLKKSCY